MFEFRWRWWYPIALACVVIGIFLTYMQIADRTLTRRVVHKYVMPVKSSDDAGSSAVTSTYRSITSPDIMAKAESSESSDTAAKEWDTLADEECCPETELLDSELAGYAEMVKDVPKEVWEDAETLRQYYEALDNYFEKFWVLDKKLEMLDREFATLDPGFLDFIFDFSDLSHLNMTPEQTDRYKAFIRERYGGLVQQDISQSERVAKMTENMNQQEEWKREYDALALEYPDLPELKHTH